MGLGMMRIYPPLEGSEGDKRRIHWTSRRPQRGMKCRMGGE